MMAKIENLQYTMISFDLLAEEKSSPNDPQESINSRWYGNLEHPVYTISDNLNRFVAFSYPLITSFISYLFFRRLFPELR